MAISPGEVRNLLKKYKIFPSKRLGQNFLVNKKVLEKIIEAAHLSPKETILEIGPGLGILTKALAKKVKKVIAIEKDPRMAEILEKEMAHFKNVEIIQADILKIEPKLKNYKIVANLPYYLTSAVIRKFLEIKSPPREMVLMVQKEVAERICSQPPRMNLLAISVQFYSLPKIFSFVSKNSFWPKPKVDSAIIKIESKKIPLKAHLKNLFFQIVKAGFAQPRKQILNNLSQMLKLDKERVRSWLSKNKILPSQRAETLSLKDWLVLVKSFDIIF